MTTPLPNPYVGDHGGIEDKVRDLSIAPPDHTHPLGEIDLTGGARTSAYVVGGDGSLIPTSSFGGGGGTTPVVGRTDLWPEDYGYDPAGTAASKQTAMQNFLNAITNGKTGRCRYGFVYEHNNVLTMTGNGGTLINQGEIRATVQTASAFKVQGNGIKVICDGGKWTCPGTTSRGSSINHEKFVLDNCSGFVGEGINVDGSHATGFFAYRATDYRIVDYTVRNTRADAFHNTNGSSGGRLINPTAYNCGDDGVAVVSYFSNGLICSDIKVIGARIHEGGARGLAVVGGNDIDYADCKVFRSSAAGVYIAVEASFNSYGCDTVRFSDIYIYQSNFSGTDHGAALFYSSVTGRGLVDCSVDNLVAENIVRDTGTFPSGWLRHITENGGTGTRLTHSNVTLRGAGPTQNVQGNMPATSYEAFNVQRMASW